MSTIEVQKQRHTISQHLVLTSFAYDTKPPQRDVDKVGGWDGGCFDERFLDRRLCCLWTLRVLTLLRDQFLNINQRLHSIQLGNTASNGALQQVLEGLALIDLDQFPELCGQLDLLVILHQ